MLIEKDKVLHLLTQWKQHKIHSREIVSFLKNKYHVMKYAHNMDDQNKPKPRANTEMYSLNISIGYCGNKSNMEGIHFHYYIIL